MRISEEPSEHIAQYHSSEVGELTSAPSEPSLYRTAEGTQFLTGARPKVRGPYYPSSDMPAIPEEEPKLGPYYRSRDMPMVVEESPKLGPYYRSRDISLESMEDIPLRKRFPKKCLNYWDLTIELEIH